MGKGIDYMALFIMLLNFLSPVLVFVQDYRILTEHDRMLNGKVFRFVTVCISCLAKVFQLVESVRSIME